MSSISTYLKKSYIRKDGRSAIYLQVIIHSEVLHIPIQTYWYPKLWADGRALFRFHADPEARDINLIIQDQEARANEIFIQYRLRRRELTKSLFEAEWITGTRSNNFLRYMEQKMEQRLREREITLSTYKTQMVTLNHLKAWKKSIPFETLTDRTAFQFDEYLLRKTGSQRLNARHGQHKNFKTYLNHAKSERIDFVHPYDYFSAKSQVGRFQPIHREELLKLWQLYLKDELADSKRQALRGFLCVCLTGMRHGDLRRFTMEWIEGDFLVWVPQKTTKYGTAVRVPVTPYLLRLLGDELAECGERKLFKGISEQKQNEYVRDIGQKLYLSTRLCYQVGRETFATLYMEADGKLEVLSSLLGHTTTKMSEKYVKIRDQRKKEEAHRIAGFLDVST